MNLLLESIPEGDPRREDVLEIKRAGDLATTLTRQLLAFSRKDVVTPRILDPNRVVARLEELLGRLIRENVRLELDLEPGAGPVRADPGQLEQVVVNLVVNARDAMPDGGRVVLRTRNAAAPGPLAPADAPGGSRWFLLEVEDAGVGMDAETLANAFEPFFTTKGRRGGTGLGLATVAGIARQCGGLVAAESAPGRGSVLRVWLPVADGAPAADAGDEGAGVAPRARAAGTVLVAEDEPLVRRLVCHVLRTAGYEVHEAARGDDALAILDRPAAPRVDALVTDLVMPGMDGHELAVRARERRPGLRVLFMTGYAAGEDLRDRVVASGEACLLKPFAPAALLDALRALVDGGGAGAARPAAPG